jgi:hypothetical protein
MLGFCASQDARRDTASRNPTLERRSSFPHLSQPMC